LIGIAKMSKYSCPQNTLSFAQWQLGVPSVPLCCSDTVSKIMICSAEFHQ